MPVATDTFSESIAEFFAIGMLTIWSQAWANIGVMPSYSLPITMQVGKVQFSS